MSKRILVVLLALSAVVILACGVSLQAAGAKVTIDGITYDGTVSGDLKVQSAPFTKEGEALWNKMYPNIKLTFLPQGDYKEDYNKFAVAAKAGGGGCPDIFSIHNDLYASKNSGYFLDLRKPPFNIGRLKSKYPSFIWKVMTNRKKEVYFVQVDAAPTCIYYRPDRLEECGLPTEAKALQKLLNTPEGVLEAAERLKARGYYMLDKNNNWLFFQALQPLMTDKDAKPIWKKEPYRSRYAKWMEMYRQLTVRELRCPIDFYSPDAWKQNKFAILPAAYWVINWPITAVGGDAEKGKWRAGYPLLGSYGMWGGSGPAVSRFTKNPAACWEFIKFISYLPNNWNLQHGGIPAYKGLYNVELFKKPWDVVGNQLWEQFFFELMKHPTECTKYDYSLNAMNWIGDMFEDYAANGGDIYAIMDKWYNKKVEENKDFIQKEAATFGEQS